MQSWTLENQGTHPWTSDYKLIWVGSGDDTPMGAPEEIEIPPCQPGARVAVKVTYQAPLEPGIHRSTWQMWSPHNGPFGEKLWTEIESYLPPACAPLPQADGVAPVQSAAQPAAASRGVSPAEAPLPAMPAQAPIPLTEEQMGGKTLQEYDPELYEAWRQHIKQGFENNTIMFNRILDAFMVP